MDTVKPTSILKKYFGLKAGDDGTGEQSNMEFIQEMKALKGPDKENPTDAYKELVELAAIELGVTPDWS